MTTSQAAAASKQQQESLEAAGAAVAGASEVEEENSYTQFMTTKEEDDDELPLWTQAACSSDDNDDEEDDDDEEGGGDRMDDSSQNQGSQKVPSSSSGLVTTNSRRLGEKMTSQQFQLQVVEEGRALKCTNEPGIICHASCSFPVTGKHTLGCTLAPPPEFDPTRGEGYVYQHPSAPPAAAPALNADLTSNCTTNSSDEGNNHKSKIYVMEGLDDNLLSDHMNMSGRSFRSGRTVTEYQRLARNLLLLFLSIGTFILLMVLIVPSYAQNRNSSNNSQPAAVEAEDPDGP